jgi:hypothetical protein
MVEESIGDSTGSKWKESWLRGFLPLIFLLFLIFPMLFLLQMNGMIICLYLESIKEDNPTHHLSEFHELMHQWEIHQEDVLMKMFMFSLAGDAREWYHSLPPASISSLGEFHAAFNAHCQKFYPSELIFHSCCEGYNDCIQGIAASYAGCEDEPDDLDQKSVLSLPCSSASEEGCEDEGRGRRRGSK